MVESHFETLCRMANGSGRVESFRYLWLAGVHVGLDQDLPNADVLAHGPQGGFHGLSCPQDGDAGDLRRRGRGSGVKARRGERSTGSQENVAHSFPLVAAPVVVRALRSLNCTRLQKETTKREAHRKVVVFFELTWTVAGRVSKKFTLVKVKGCHPRNESSKCKIV